MPRIRSMSKPKITPGGKNSASARSLSQNLSSTFIDSASQAVANNEEKNMEMDSDSIIINLDSTNEEEAPSVDNDDSDPTYFTSYASKKSLYSNKSSAKPKDALKAATKTTRKSAQPTLNVSSPTSTNELNLITITPNLISDSIESLVTLKTNNKENRLENDSPKNFSVIEPDSPSKKKEKNILAPTTTLNTQPSHQEPVNTTKKSKTKDFLSRVYTKLSLPAPLATSQLNESPAINRNKEITKMTPTTRSRSDNRRRVSALDKKKEADLLNTNITNSQNEDMDKPGDDKQVTQVSNDEKASSEISQRSKFKQKNPKRIITNITSSIPHETNIEPNVHEEAMQMCSKHNTQSSNENIVMNEPIKSPNKETNQSELITSNIEIVSNVEASTTSLISNTQNSMSQNTSQSDLRNHSTFSAKNLAKRPRMIDEDNDNMSVTSNSTTANETIKKAHKETNFKDDLFKVALKLAYLNSVGELNDQSFEFLFESISFLKNEKHTLSKLMANNVDEELTKGVSSSPLYSLTLHVDPSLVAVFVYINFINHSSLNSTSSSETLQTKLLRVINLKPLDTPSLNTSLKQPPIKMKSIASETKWSRYIFEQIKNNIIQFYRLNKQNLMCISFEEKLLERICLPTFQLYLNDFFHKTILILPNFKCNHLIEDTLKGSDKVEAYFRNTLDMAKQMSQMNVEDIDKEKVLVSFDDMIEIIQSYNAKFFFNDSANLSKLKSMLETIYSNLTQIKANLKNSTKNLLNIIESTEYEFITSFLIDLCQFLTNYEANPKRYGVDDHLKISSSTLKTSLVNQQAKSNSSTEFETLEKLRTTIENNLMLDMDFYSNNSIKKEKYSHLLTSQVDLAEDDFGHLNDDSSISMLEIYSILVEMFDIQMRHIKLADKHLKHHSTLEKRKLQKLIDFYEFKKLIGLDDIQSQYVEFVEKFCSTIPKHLESDLNTTLNDDSLLSSTSKFRNNFIEFTFKCNEKKICPIISFLATVFLCLPPIVEFKYSHLIEKNQKTATPIYLNTQEIASLEHKIKIYEANKTGNKKAVFTWPLNFNDIPFSF